MGVVRNRPAYLVLGLNMDGKKEALALVIGTGDESAKFWLKVLTDLRNRGLRQVCVVCCDGLTALPVAIEAVYADAWVQCCVVHLIRNSLRHVSYKDHKAIVKDLRPIYQAATEDDSLDALDAFERKRGARYPMIGELWAPPLGTVHSVLRVPGRDPQDRLHHELDRGRQPPAPQDHQDARTLPDRRRRRSNCCGSR